MEDRKLLKVTMTFGKDNAPKIHINDEVENLKSEAKKAVQANNLMKLTDITERARLLHKDLKKKLASFQSKIENIKQQYPNGSVFADGTDNAKNVGKNILDEMEDLIKIPIKVVKGHDTGKFTQNMSNFNLKSSFIPDNLVVAEVSDLDKFMFNVARELEAQDRKWGANRDKNPLEWQSILMEEVGEVANEINESNFDDIVGDNYLKEVIQVAACAFRMYEQELRNKKPDSGNNNPKTEI